jgi:hypothetical protein
VNPSLDVLDRLAAALAVKVDVLLRTYDAKSVLPKSVQERVPAKVKS